METSTPVHSGPTETTISAQTGANICAPDLHGCLFQSPVNFTFIHGGQHVCSSSSRGGQSGGPPCVPALTEDLITVHKGYKEKLGDKSIKISEGISQHGRSTLLNKIYTELYITEGGSGEVNDEHEHLNPVQLMCCPTEGYEERMKSLYKPTLSMWFYMCVFGFLPVRSWNSTVIQS
ncbi:hypothetical protein AOLI_G00152700 [Acnodon oligacanthus]